MVILLLVFIVCRYHFYAIDILVSWPLLSVLHTQLFCCVIDSFFTVDINHHCYTLPFILLCLPHFLINYVFIWLIQNFWGNWKFLPKICRVSHTGVCCCFCLFQDSLCCCCYITCSSLIKSHVMGDTVGSRATWCLLVKPLDTVWTTVDP